MREPFTIQETEFLLEGITDAIVPKVPLSLRKAVKSQHSFGNVKNKGSSLKQKAETIKDVAFVAATTATKGPEAGLLSTLQKIFKKHRKKQQEKVLSIPERHKPSSANLVSSDTQNTNNKIKIKPQGILIQDTFNNLLFPIPEPELDTIKFNLPLIKYYYKLLYTKNPVEFLPWHFVIEVIEGEYYTFATRPLDMKYPVSTFDAEDLITKNNLTPNKEAQYFFKTKPFDLQDAIHVCILGDSNRDVYIDKLYEYIGRLCSGPILRYWRLPNKSGQRVINFNLGEKFIFSKLDHHLSR